MFNKKNITLFLVLIILTLIAYAYKVPYQEWQKKVKKPINFLWKIDLDKIDKIEINKNEQVSILEKQMENKWKIADTKDFYVKKQDLINLLDALKKAQESDFKTVSINLEKKSEFKTNQQGTEIKLIQDDQEKISFIVGKMTPDYQGSYLAIKDKNETYSVAVNFFSIFNKSDWRDKTILSLDKDKINKLRFQYPNHGFILEKNEENWKGIEPDIEIEQQEKVSKIVDLLSNLGAVQIPEQSFENTGLEKNLIILQILGQDIDQTIMIGENNEDDQYFIKKADSDNIYLITKEQRDELDLEIKDFK